MCAAHRFAGALFQAQDFGGGTVKAIGVIANPASGKDIRRLVSYATVIDNLEKVNISKRIVLAAQAMGIQTVYFMQDTFQIGFAVQDDLQREGVLAAEVTVLDLPLTASAEDSTNAAAEMERLGAGCIVVLGGDGTSRAVAKGITETPIVPVSTGTNNTYPVLMEGTVAGMAAAAAAIMGKHTCCIRDKCIRVFINGEMRDIALVDAVWSDLLYVGSKAIWDMASIKRIVVTRCRPSSIGFSAIPGCIEVVRDTDDHGFALSTGTSAGISGAFVRAPVAAGVIEKIYIEDAHIQPFGPGPVLTAQSAGMLALDGEREVKFKKGDSVEFRIARDGPWRVLFHEILEEAKNMGFFTKEIEHGANNSNA